CRIAHEGHQKQLKRFETSQRLSQSRGLWRMLAFFRLQVSEGLQAPPRLSTHIEKAAFGSCLRGKQKGELRLLKPKANPCAEGLKLLEEGQLGIVVFQDIGDKVRHIANPASPIGGLKQGLDDSFLHI